MPHPQYKKNNLKNKILKHNSAVKNSENKLRTNDYISNYYNIKINGFGYQWVWILHLAFSRVFFGFHFKPR